MYTVTVKYGRWHWWIRERVFRVSGGVQAWNIVHEFILRYKWYRYRVDGPDTAAGGGNF